MKIIILVLVGVLSISCFGQSSNNRLVELQQQKDSIKSLQIALENQIREIDKELASINESKKNNIEKSNILLRAEITNDGVLRLSPVPGSEIITEIIKGDSVDVIRIEKDYYKIKYKDTVGYISELYLYNPSLARLSKSQKLETEGITNQAEFQNLVDIYGETIARKITNQEIWIGMTKLMTISSIGKPDDIKKTITQWGTDEQWIYNGVSKTQYLYFENGKLSVIQDF